MAIRETKGLDSGFGPRTEDAAQGFVGKDNGMVESKSRIQIPWSLELGEGQRT